jgi:AAA+ ATPase superfamily predicted ATPase
MPFPSGCNEELPSYCRIEKQIQKLDARAQRNKSEFLSVYGRLRVGKTFLIREYFVYRFGFQVSAVANTDTWQPLFNFDSALRKKPILVFETPCGN